MQYDNGIDLRPLPRDRKLKPAQQKIVAAAREFESVMIDQMLKTMRETVKPEGIDGGSTMGMYQDMMDEQMARVMAHGQGIGLSAPLERQLLGFDPEHPPKDPPPHVKPR